MIKTRQDAVDAIDRLANTLMSVKDQYGEEIEEFEDGTIDLSELSECDDAFASSIKRAVQDLQAVETFAIIMSRLQS